MYKCRCMEQKEASTKSNSISKSPRIFLQQFWALFLVHFLTIGICYYWITMVHYSATFCSKLTSKTLSSSYFETTIGVRIFLSWTKLIGYILCMIMEGECYCIRWSFEIHISFEKGNHYSFITHLFNQYIYHIQDWKSNPIDNI